MFFKKKKITLKKLYPNKNFQKDFVIENVSPLILAKEKDLTFFDSIKYKDEAIKTKSKVCITTEKLKDFLPEKINKIIVKNVLFELATILNKIYIDAEIDYPDKTLKNQQKNIKM